MTTTSRSAKYAKWLSIPLGLAISALLIWQASYAAFSDTTTNPNNRWQAGSVVLENDHDGVVLFSEKDLKPGSAETSEPLTVTYKGTLDADVAFSVKKLGGSSELAKYINVTVNIENSNHNYTGPAFSGTLASLSQTPATSGGTPIKPGDWAEVTLTYSLDSAAPDSVQNQTVTADFVLVATNR